MAMLTWLGEDELHGGGAGPSFTHAFGDIKFPKNEPVEVRSHAIVQKAMGNQFFSVDGEDEVDDLPTKRGPGRPRKEKAEEV